MVAAKSSQFIIEWEAKGLTDAVSTSPPSSVKRKRCNSDSLPKRLLICDLNGVLVLKKASAATYVRPSAGDFLRRMSRYFTLGIWSSGKRKTIKAILKKVLPQSDVPFLFVWTQEKCDHVDGVFQKHLPKLWNTFPAYSARNTVMLPYHEEYHRELHQILLDDSMAKCSMNPAHTSIHPPPYEGKVGDAELVEGSRLCQYLISLSESNQDIPDFIREQPFDTPTTSRSTVSNGLL